MARMPPVASSATLNHGKVPILMKSPASSANEGAGLGMPRDGCRARLQTPRTTVLGYLRSVPSTLAACARGCRSVRNSWFATAMVASSSPISVWPYPRKFLAMHPYRLYGDGSAPPSPDDTTSTRRPTHLTPHPSAARRRRLQARSVSHLRRNRHAPRRVCGAQSIWRASGVCTERLAPSLSMGEALVELVLQRRLQVPHVAGVLHRHRGAHPHLFALRPMCILAGPLSECSPA